MDCSNLNFKELRQFAGYNKPEDAAKYCGVSRSTIHNWDKNEPPLYIRKLFEFLNEDLGAYDPQWRGFHFENGFIYGPGRMGGIHAGHVAGRNYFDNLSRAKSQENSDLRQEIKHLKEQIETLKTRLARQN
ncbi:MAG: XRE family transcriptional regulator, partial [Methylococcaceae bacterium]